MFSLKFEGFFLHFFQIYKVKPVPTLVTRAGVSHCKCHMDVPTKGLETVFQGHGCYSVYLNAQSHLPKSQLWYPDPLNTCGSDVLFFSVITGNKGGVTFFSILSSGYVPLSPHDANFHPYKDIFCRAVFSWCNFGTSKWQ